MPGTDLTQQRSESNEVRGDRVGHDVEIFRGTNVSVHGDSDTAK